MQADGRDGRAVALLSAIRKSCVWYMSELMHFVLNSQFSILDSRLSTLRIVIALAWLYRRVAQRSGVSQRIEIIAFLDSRFSSLRIAIALVSLYRRVT